ncbi:class E sortase [bacterium]|nr:class E sortase [bacterium]
MQNKKKRNISSTILIVFIVIFLVAGIALIAYPLLTNIPANVEKGSRIAGWQLLKDKFKVKTQEGQSSSDTDTTTTATGTAVQTEITGLTTQTSVSEQQSQGHSEESTTTSIVDSDIDESVKYTAEDIFPSKINIPKIGIEWIVNEGADVPTLKKGPGHIPETPLPGEKGRCTISGHRTTYGAPFNRIDELKNGDLIYLEALNGVNYIYKVTSFQVVKPTYVEILNGTNKKELLLTTCYPEYSSRERLVVVAEQIKIFPFDLDLK